MATPMSLVRAWARRSARQSLLQPTARSASPMPCTHPSSRPVSTLCKHRLHPACARSYSALSSHCLSMPALLCRHAHMTVGHKESDGSSSIVDVPSFISPPALASLLGVTLRRLAKDARHYLPWWPQDITERRMLRSGYNNVKALILSYEEAAAIARLYNRNPQRHIMEGSDLQREPEERRVQRSPVIAILGHKDHGKTTLLDSLRGTKVAEREEFGITQETYTFQVTLDEQSTESERQRALSSAPAIGVSRTFTFLDTPGHHSFTEMRAQAAAHADVVLLVVAADEGLLDQSFESLNIVTQFTVPIVVAITKTALPTSHPDRVRRELQRLGARLLDANKPTLSVRGEMVAVEVSVKEGQGLDVLRRALFGVTSLLPLSADVNAVCMGSVLEAWREDKGRGDVVRVLVKEGTLRVGDWFVSDLAGGRVKAMRNSRKEAVDECGPGGVAEVMGADMLPSPGSEFFVCSKQASTAIREVRRLEQAYSEQDRFTQKKPRRSRVGQEEEAEEEEEDQPASAPDDEQRIAPEPTLPPRSQRASRAVPSFFSTPRPTDRPSASPRPPSPPTPFDELRVQDDYDPLPVIIKASSRGHLRMVSHPTPTSALPLCSPRVARLITPLRCLSAVVYNQLMDSIDVINKDLKIPLILVVESGVGVVTKTDVQYSQAYECPIYTFRVKSPMHREQTSLRRFNIAVHSYAHFQHLIDHITRNMQAQYDRRRVGEGKSPLFASPSPSQLSLPAQHPEEGRQSTAATVGQT